MFQKNLEDIDSVHSHTYLIILRLKGGTNSRYYKIISFHRTYFSPSPYPYIPIP